MDIGKLSVKLVDSMLEKTVDYKPSPLNLDQNKKRMGYGLMVTAGGALTGMYPVAIGGAAYTALKMYHVQQDRRSR